MEIIPNYIKQLFAKPSRQPASSGNVVALSGAVLVHTEDGNNIVVTPDLAREIAKNLVHMANRADGEPDATKHI